MSKNDICHVLILEDMDEDIELVKRVTKKTLPEAVFNVARTREEFLQKIQWVVPQVILSDYNLPDYNGLEALTHVHATHPHIPFIFVTGALNNDKKVADAIFSGAAAYVLKDELSKLKEILPAVMKTSREKFEREEEDRQRVRQAKMKLQKAVALLEKSDLADDNKADLVNILKEVQGNLTTS